MAQCSGYNVTRKPDQARRTRLLLGWVPAALSDLVLVRRPPLMEVRATFKLLVSRLSVTDGFSTLTLPLGLGNDMIQQTNRCVPKMWETSEHSEAVTIANGIIKL
ncbi:hypothetical protein J6590_015074 [Homalodisca vitripennis]|nr:hypothetical protein J6590_015074 [Homalodisca vitripennis]